MLLAIGGANSNGLLASIEIINVDTTVGCSFASYPFAVGTHASSATPDEIVMCGGLTAPPVGIGLTDLAKSGGGRKYPFTLRFRRL